MLTHVNLVIAGVKSSLTHPLGQGTAVTNGAAGVNPNSANTAIQATEVDISNAFVAFGIPGGVLYVVLVLMILFTAIQGFFRGRSWLLPIIALLITGLGQWLIGGDYALSSLSWLLIGAVAATHPRFEAAAARGKRRKSSITSSAAVERLTHAVVHVDVEVVGEPPGEVRPLWRRACRADSPGSGR